MPPLRERLGDIPLLANHFLRHFCKETGREIIGFTEPRCAAMLRYDWPGNVRELENAIERAVVLCRRPQIDVDDLPETLQTTGAAPRTATHRPRHAAISPTNRCRWKRAGRPERRIIEAALKRNNWNRQATAAELDINRTTLYKKMRKFGLDIGESNYASAPQP